LPQFRQALAEERANPMMTQETRSALDHLEAWVAALSAEG